MKQGHMALVTSSELELLRAKVAQVVKAADTYGASVELFDAVSVLREDAALAPTRQAEPVAFADGENPCVLEWGAVSLPMGDPSRATNLQLFPTLWAAIAEGALCGFDWRVYPMAIVSRT